MADEKETKVGELEKDDVVEETPSKEETPPKEETPAEPKEGDLAAAIRELKETVKPKEEKPQLTQAQIDEMWAVYDPEKSDKDFYKKFFKLNPDATQEEADATKKLFADVQQGLVKQSLTGARNFDKILLDEIEKKIAPALEYVSRAEMRERQDRFYDSYPALKESTYSKVIDGVAKSIADKEFESEADYFKALADGAAELIKSVKPDFDVGKPQQQTGKTPKLSRSGVGGGGGAGKAPKKEEKDVDDSKVNELEPEWTG